MMNNKKAKTRRLYDATFHDPKVWTDWFFDNVYSDSSVMTLTAEGIDGDLEPDATPASMLMVQPYSFSFHGTEMPLAYVSCAATARRERGRGLMGTLIDMAMMRTAERGTPLAALIPASPRLFSYYGRRAFATTVYVDIERYTAVHRFENSGNYVECEPDYEALSRLERRHDCTVMHTATEMSRIVADARLDGGCVTAVRHIADGDIRAIAVAVPDSETLQVRQLLATDSDAAEAVLDCLRLRHTGMPIEVFAAPSERDRTLTPRAMMRVLDAEAMLRAMAAVHPQMRQTIRLHDYLIERNNAVFDVADGKCRRIGSDEPKRPLTLDVEIDVLTRLLFSAPKIGEVFGFPSCRASLPLMLD